VAVKSEIEVTWKDLEVGSIVTEPGSAAQYQTGGWRSQRPAYFKEEESVPSCKVYCPINQDIRKWLRLIREEKFQEAWLEVLGKDPMPAIIGRVCPHFCEQNCNRKDFDEPVAIRSLEKFLGDEAMKKGWTLPARKIGPGAKKIAVIGSGPAGLACAFYLAREGYKITIYEELPVIGGMLTVSIPDYRLPKTISGQEIEKNILSLGITVEKNTKVDDTVLSDISKKFDAIFVAVGAQRSTKLNIEGENSRGVISGLEFLKKINLVEPLQMGNEVAIIGGGNTAIDAAHSALKLGAKVTIYYRRSVKEMPAIESEVAAAKKDGVKIQTLANPVRILVRNGRVIGLELVKMKLGEKDESGRARPIPVQGSNFNVQADMVIAAIGEEERPDFGKALEQNQKIFKGEVVGTVAAALNCGGEAAKQIMSYLKTGRRTPPKEKVHPRLVEFKDLNAYYLEHQPRQSRVTRPQSAVNEAFRCFSCGFCNMCGNCWMFCPDAAIAKTDGQFEINYFYCKGCAICQKECPRGAIYVMPEEE